MNFNINSFLKHKAVFCKIPYNNLNINISKVLFKNGLVSHYKKYMSFNNVYIILYFKYFENKNVIRDIKIISKSSRAVTTNNKNMKFKKNSLLLSTSNGFYIQSNYRSYRIGGKVMFFINC